MGERTLGDQGEGVGPALLRGGLLGIATRRALLLVDAIARRLERRQQDRTRLRIEAAAEHQHAVVVGIGRQ